MVHKSLIRWKVAYREVAFLGEMLFSAKCPFPNSVAATLMQWSIYSTAFIPWYGLEIEQDSSHVESRQCVELIKKEAACAAEMMGFFPDKVTKPPSPTEHFSQSSGRSLTDACLAQIFTSSLRFEAWFLF